MKVSDRRGKPTARASPISVVPSLSMMPKLVAVEVSFRNPRKRANERISQHQENAKTSGQLTVLHLTILPQGNIRGRGQHKTNANRAEGDDWDAHDDQTRPGWRAVRVFHEPTLLNAC